MLDDRVGHLLRGHEVAQALVGLEQQHEAQAGGLRAGVAVAERPLVFARGVESLQLGR